MNVRELIEELKAVDPTLEVMLSSDAEGNGHGALVTVGVSGTDTWGQPCHPDDADPDERKVVVLWP